MAWITARRSMLRALLLSIPRHPSTRAVGFSGRGVDGYTGGILKRNKHLHQTDQTPGPRPRQQQGDNGYARQGGQECLLVSV